MNIEPAFVEEFAEWSTSLLEDGGFGGAATDWGNLVREHGPVYLETPASSSPSRHHAYKGGLLVHSLEVAALAFGAIRGGAPLIRGSSISPEYMAPKCLVAGFLHDFNKTRDLKGRRLYLDNVLKSGKVSDAKPWVRNKEFLSVDPAPGGSGDEPGREDEFSRMVVNSFSDKIPEGWVSACMVDILYPGFLSQMGGDVRQAMELHDGGYSRSLPTGHFGSEQVLAIAIHYADMVSARGHAEIELLGIDALEEVFSG
jgi:hypothetical protein